MDILKHEWRRTDKIMRPLRRLGRGLCRKSLAVVRLSWNPLRLLYGPIALLITFTSVPAPSLL